MAVMTAASPHLAGDPSSDCRFAGQTGLVPAMDTLHWEPSSSATLSSSTGSVLAVWEEGGGREEGGTTGAQRFIISFPISKHQTWSEDTQERPGQSGSWLSDCWGWINANIMIVFTPIKIPNNLTLIIYIIRSQASQSATETQTREGRRGEGRSGEERRGIFKFSLFLQNISGRDWVGSWTELLALW